MGRMMIQDAINIDVNVHVLDPDPKAPCSSIAHTFTCGSITEFQSVYNFGKDKDVLTVEIEHVSIEALKKLEAEGVRVFPQAEVLEIIKDKGLQKEFYTKHDIPTAPYRLIEAGISSAELASHLPFVQKLRVGGYDGKGVQIIRTEEELDKCFSEASIIEELIPFEKELSVIVARNEKGEIRTYPSVECEFNDANLVAFLFSPAEISIETELKAQAVARKVVEALELVGLLAVELFLTKEGAILVNEIAPRPHNSGHHTIECHVTSQFEQHLRAILNLPLGSSEQVLPGAMINLIGEPGFNGEVFYEGLTEILEIPGVHPHLYGKEETKPNRKMGHVSICGKNLTEVKALAKRIQDKIRVISKEQNS